MGWSPDYNQVCPTFVQASVLSHMNSSDSNIAGAQIIHNAIIDLQHQMEIRCDQMENQSNQRFIALEDSLTVQYILCICVVSKLTRLLPYVELTSS